MLQEYRALTRSPVCTSWKVMHGGELNRAPGGILGRA